MSCKNIYKFPLLNESIVSRFLSKIKGGKHGCWRWRAGKTIWGYGQFWIDGKEFPAHRVAYYIFKKENPRGLFVLHRCDVRDCVNPDHLFLGTQKDNILDCHRKGRGVSWNRGKSLVNVKRNKKGQFIGKVFFK